MKVTEVKVYVVDLGSDGRGGTYSWHPVVCQVLTSDGISGIGEAAIAYGCGATGAAGMVRDLAAQFVVGRDPFPIEAIWNDMYHHSFWAKGGGPLVFAGISALEMALWDIKGKAFNCPSYELLGGKCRDRIRMYANGWYHTAVTPADFARQAEKVVADGYNAMKFDPFLITPQGKRISPVRILDRDFEDYAYDRVVAVREAVGPRVDILVEVHGNLSTDTAIRMGKRLEALKPFAYEEPVDPFNVDAMKKVSENVNIPIAGGERLYTRYGFRQFIEKQALDILQPDVGNTGGIMETKKIAAMGEVYNMHVQPHNCAGPIATAAAVQVDACITNFIIQELFPYRSEGNYAIVDDAPERRVKDSYLDIQAKPGLGVELNEKAVKDSLVYTVRSSTGIAF